MPRLGANGFLAPSTDEDLPRDPIWGSPLDPLRPVLEVAPEDRSAVRADSAYRSPWCIALAISGLFLFIVWHFVISPASPTATTYTAVDRGKPAPMSLYNHSWKPGPGLWAPSVKGWSPKIKTYFHGGHECPDQAPPCTLRQDMLDLMNKYTVAGFDWSHGVGQNLDGRVAGRILGRGTEIIRDAIEQFKRYLKQTGNLDTMTFAYRQMQVALRYFSAEEAVADASGSHSQGLWIALPDPRIRQVYAYGGVEQPQPWGTNDPAWDFASPYVQDFYVNSIIADLMQDASFAGGRTAVFFDEVDQGGCCTQSFPPSYTQGVYSMLPRIVKKLNDRGIIPILSIFNRLPYLGRQSMCNRPFSETLDLLRELQWVHFYENWPYTPWESVGKSVVPSVFAASINNAIEEAKLGIPTILHTGWFFRHGLYMEGPTCPPTRTVQQIQRPGLLGGEFEWLIAAYLVVQSPGTLLSFSTDWNMGDQCYQPDFEVEFGVPLGPPLVDESGMKWTREYTNATAVVDLRNRLDRGANYLAESTCGLADGCGHVYLK